MGPTDGDQDLLPPPEEPAAEPPPEEPAVEPPPAEPAPEREQRTKLSRRLLYAAAGVAALAAAWAIHELVTWPDVAALADANPETTAFIERYRRQSGSEPEQRWVPYGRISGHLKLAVLVAEDIEFFDHDGFSRHEMKQALKDALEEGKPLRGASTLTQQLAKNLWLSPSRNPWRKVKEALLTRQLENRLSKHRILEIYLNVVELGPGVYGAEAAARKYFGTSAAALGEREAAALAAALPRPRSWHPGSGSRTAERRAARILGRMRRAGWLRQSL